MRAPSRVFRNTSAVFLGRRCARRKASRTVPELARRRRARGRKTSARARTVPHAVKNVPRARDAVTRPLARRRRGDSADASEVRLFCVRASFASQNQIVLAHRSPARRRLTISSRALRNRSDGRRVQRELFPRRPRPRARAVREPVPASAPRRVPPPPPLSPFF